MNRFINSGKLRKLAIATILAILCDAHRFSSHGSLRRAQDTVWKLQDVARNDPRKALCGRSLRCSHQLRVIAANEVQLWTGAGSAIEFSIGPKFDQTATLRMICGLAVINILWFAYQLRIRVVIRRARELLAERLAERERIAAELHDTLLQSVQGLVLFFHGISAQMPKDLPLVAKVDSAIDRVQQLLDQTRDGLRDLHMVSFDLASAFRQLGKNF